MANVLNKPRSINIFLLDGDPNGIRVAQITMSTIQAIAFRRNKLGDVRKTFPEIERPRVYILIGEDESEPDRQLAYIGESEGVGDRLGTHNCEQGGSRQQGFLDGYGRADQQGREPDEKPCALCRGLPDPKHRRQPALVFA